MEVREMSQAGCSRAYSSLPYTIDVTNRSFGGFLQQFAGIWFEGLSWYVLHVRSILSG
jgi:hypothetical protein